MRSAALAEYRAMSAHQHSGHAATSTGELKRLPFWATFNASRAVPSASLLGAGTLHMRTTAMRCFWASRAAFRFESPVTFALLALTPSIPGALAAALLNSCDWCYGMVRVWLAVCVVGVVATCTLLLSWNLDPASMRRAVSYAIGAGLSAAVPLLLF
jgi:hypothetical protein